MPTSGEIRQQYIDYFVEKAGHAFVPSSPVVPHNDPTLLFANAGMNQFKPYFLGTEQPPDPPRAVNTQKCIRAGGKHNDLDDVGKDSYHHTYFEMLGNWSFGDYFKAEAIEWAWDLLTDVWGIDGDRLHATYFEGDASEGLEPDLEAKELWGRFMPPERIHPGNKKDNFWEMGDTGPCGPCSELHYDRSPDKSGAALVNADAQDTVVEIWNLVFIQFNRGADSKLSPLPAKHVDTGMGFERIVRVLQGKESNYDTDVFTPLFTAIQQVTGARAYDGGAETLSDPIDTAYRVIADHIRCLTFALSDGAHCGNTGRDSVLRTILRRAVRYGHQQLGVEEPFFYKLVPAVVEQLGNFFPELKKNPDAVAAELKEEEEAFRSTLAKGIVLFDEAAKQACDHFFQQQKVLHAKDADKKSKLLAWCHKVLNYSGQELPGYWNVSEVNWTSYPLNGRPSLNGKSVFDLEATYGFPISLTCVMAEERGLTVDMAGYEKAKAEHADISRAGAGSCDVTALLVEINQQHDLPATQFLGYDHDAIDGTADAEHTSHRWVFKLDDTGATPVEQAEVGDRIALVTERTVFYAESGGQVGDTGTIACQCGATMRVTDTQKVGDVFFHLGEVTEGSIVQRLDERRPLIMNVDADRRALTMNNHTTTHVMNRALRGLVNPEADQRGSLVDPDKLRFDFSNPGPVETAQLDAVEQQVNADIAADLPVHWQVAPQEDALKINGLRAVFGEKYPPEVRVVSIGASVDELLADPSNEQWGGLSIEFCGGTHLQSTGKAEAFCITSEEGVAKGIRRITALTGPAAKQAITDADALLKQASTLPTDDAVALQKQVNTIAKAVDTQTLPAVAKAAIRSKLAEAQETLKKHVKAQAKQSAGAAVDVARKLADEMTGRVIVADLGQVDGGAIRTAMDVFKKKHPDAAILLAGASGDKVALMATVAKPLIGQGLKAGDWIKHVAPIVGGGGGGRPDSAQAGGKDPAKIDEALDAARAFASELIP